MKAGDLRHRITIQRLVLAPDEYGQPVEYWQDVATCWAAVEPLRGRELFVAQQAQSEVTTRVRLRYRAGITPDMRVLFGARVLEILYVIDPEERHRELQLLCREVI